MFCKHVLLISLSPAFLSLPLYAGGNIQDPRTVDPMTLSATDAAALELPVLSYFISELASTNAQEQTMYKQIKAFNSLMCQNLAALNSSCLTQTYFYQPTTDDLGCGLPTGSPPVIKVTATNLKGYTFRIRANQDFFSSEISEGGGVISFQRKNKVPAPPPRFRSITEMSLVSVVPGSVINSMGYLQKIQAINSADQSELINKLEFRITVNDTPITGDSNKMQILAPSDPSKTTELRIEPNTIVKMGKTPQCVLSADKVKQLQSQANGGGQ